MLAEENWDEIADFWRILELNLARRHGASPVHSLEEIQLLHDRFPDEILLDGRQDRRRAGRRDACCSSRAPS